MEQRKTIRYQLVDSRSAAKKDARNFPFMINGTSIHGNLVDIGPGGVGIEILDDYGYAGEKLAGSPKCIIRMVFPDGDVLAESVLAWGSVGDGAFIGGMRFLAMDPAERLRLSAIIEAIRTA